MGCHMISAKSILRIAPAAAPYADQLVRQMREAGIMNNVKRASSFLGQIHVESGGFRSVVENLNYSSDSLKRIFGRHRISLADAEKFGRNDDHPANQSAIANIIYGGDFGLKNLGNSQSGDGWRFRGRGLKQLTGRDNYRRFSRAWLGDESLLDTPDKVAAPDGAVASAVWFWKAKGLNEIADRGSVDDVTSVVNGGSIGLADRKTWTEAYAKLWGV